MLSPNAPPPGVLPTHISVSYAGWDEARQEYWAYIESNEGSYGARHGSDGLDSVDTLMANTRNTPIEELELRYPLRVVRYELRGLHPHRGNGEVESG